MHRHWTDINFLSLSLSLSWTESNQRYFLRCWNLSLINVSNVTITKLPVYLIFNLIELHRNINSLWCNHLRCCTYSSESTLVAIFCISLFFAVVSVSKLFTHFHNWLYELYLSILTAWWGIKLAICQIFYSVCGIIILHINHHLFHQ